jgi:hypothetical protein
LLVTCAPAVAEYLYDVHVGDMLRVEEQIGARLVVRPMAHFHPEQFDISVGVA